MKPQKALKKQKAFLSFLHLINLRMNKLMQSGELRATTNTATNTTTSTVLSMEMKVEPTLTWSIRSTRSRTSTTRCLPWRVPGTTGSLSVGSRFARLKRAATDSTASRGTIESPMFAASSSWWNRRRQTQFHSLWLLKSCHSSLLKLSYSPRELPEKMPYGSTLRESSSKQTI